MTNNRIFNISDAELIEHAQVTATALSSDMASFTAFDSTLKDTYPSLIFTAIEKFNGFKSDMIVINEQATLTQQVNNALADCNLAFKTIMFFAKKAFPNNEAIQKQFGKSEIEHVRKSQPKLLLFMESLIETANKFKAQLVDAGCNAQVIDSLVKKTEALRMANINQELTKKDRGINTQERVACLNELYSLLKPISEIAQIVYSDDLARLDKYSLPKPKSVTNTVEDIIEA